MKIYIAAKFKRRMQIRPKRDTLWHMGYEVLSSWLDEIARPPGMDQATFNKKVAIKDLCEVYACDFLLLDTAADSETGGKENEYGFALGLFHKKQVFVVGPKRSVFHELCDKHFETWDDCLAYMREISPGGTSAIHQSGTSGV